jgi:predicted nuclease with TOPRIM domain
MSDISELERRLTAALDRISSGVANAAPTAPLADDGKIAELTTANDALTERVDRLEARALRLTDRLEDAEGENARLEAVIDALKAHADALSAANTAHQDAGDTVNAAMASELSELRAARKADIAQMDEILAELAPAVKEA